MTKWIQDFTIASVTQNLPCDEVHITHVEAYNSLSGNPQYQVRLAVDWASRYLAITRLLGVPEQWPYTTPFDKVYAVEARIVNDQGAYTADADAQVIQYTEKALIDVTYMPRNGVYRVLTTSDPVGGGTINQPVYIDDVEKPRTETVPMNHMNFFWGDTTGTAPADKSKVLLSQESPTIFNIGQTLVHTIEGWCGALDVSDFVGTVNQYAYTSPVNGRTYGAGTLMLRDYSLTRAFNFRSYRLLGDPAPTASFIDFARIAGVNLQMVYEYKSLGWERFFHTALNATPGYHYIHRRESPYTKFTPFPVANHSIFFVSSP
jgi:hypothetical protein